jgi:hypothetical protein
LQPFLHSLLAFVRRPLARRLLSRIAPWISMFPPGSQLGYLLRRLRQTILQCGLAPKRTGARALARTRIPS